MNDHQSLAAWGTSVGLDLPEEELRRARTIIEGYKARVDALRSLDLEREQLPAEQPFPADWGDRS